MNGSLSMKQSCLITLCFFFTSTTSLADIQKTALDVAEQSKTAVVTVRVVLNVKRSIRGQTRDEERKTEALGTIINNSGLTVASLSAVDPTTVIRTMMRRSRNSGNSIESEFKETTLILDDGTEVESDIVLKDRDLDMVFIKPRQGEFSFKPVKLKLDHKKPQLLDPVFVVGRLGKLGNRAITLNLGRIQSSVKGPRPYYICDTVISVNVGCIVYDALGDPVGILLTKQNALGFGSGSSSLSGNQMIMPILRSIDDLMEIATQVKDSELSSAE
ncbi:MAG: hypothetical protein MK025_07740 [Acidobacteriia bacterium]|nr:hypothetical protein [Terriglobia bacterium]